MRRVSLVVAGVVAVLVGMGLATYAVAAPNKKAAKHKAKTRKFSEALTGAQISSSGNKSVVVYQAKSSLDGPGAGVQRTTVTGSTFPLTGTDKFTTYYANGVDNAADKFTLATPDANGNSAITGTGKCLGGTGVHRHEKCSYTFTGTYNINTLVATVSAHGTAKR